MPEPLPLPAEVLPHKAPMVLIDCLLAYAPEQLRAEVVVRADSPFCRAGQVGGWVGIEYMAQTVAALAGLEARERGEAVSVGFLLGARRYLCHVPAFSVGARLEVSVRRELQSSEGLAAFECAIHDGTLCCAEATLSVYQPDHLDDYLRQSAGQ